MRLGFIARRNLRRNLSATIRNTIGIAIATFVVMFLFSLIGGMEHDLKKTISTQLSGDVRLQNIEYEKNQVFNPAFYLIENEDKISEKMQSVEGIEKISKKLLIPVTYYQAEGIDEGSSVLEPLELVGVNFGMEEEYNGFSSFIKEGRLPSGEEREILLGVQTAEKFDLGVGDKITLLGSTAQRTQNGMTFTVVGIFSYPTTYLNVRKAIISLPLAQKFFHSPNAVTQIDMQISKSKQKNYKGYVKKIQKEIDELGLSQEVKATQWRDVNSMGNFMITARLIYSFIGMLFFFLASLVVYNTIYLSLHSRRFELGVISAMGLSNKDVRKIFRYEVFYMTVMGVLFGTILAGVLIGLFGKVGLNMSGFGLASDGNSIINSVIYPYLGPLFRMMLMIYSFVVCYLIGGVPIRIIKKETTLSLLKAGE